MEETPNPQQDSGAPTEEPLIYRVSALPHGKFHMALKCWEAFLWQQFAVRSLKGTEEDISVVNNALSEMVLRFIFGEQWTAVASVLSAEVGRVEGGESEDDKRWRIRSITVFGNFVVEGEAIENWEDIPARKIKVLVEPYDG